MSQQWLGVYHAGVVKGLFNASLTWPCDSDFVAGDVVKVNSTGADSCELVATRNSAFSRVLHMLARFDMNPVHPTNVMHEATNTSIQDALADPALEDLTHVPFVTIDNEDSRDLDQALYIEQTSNGSFLVHYALADAAWFIRPGSALHDEALRRGVTYYAPHIAVTMLPTVLSENLISLNPEVERRALVFSMILDPSGTLVSTDINQAKIISHAKLSYDGVQTFLDATVTNQPHPYLQEPWHQSLQLLASVGVLRLKLAAERDVIEFNRSEAQVRIDPNDDTKFVVEVRQRNDVEQYNEQISLLCNTAGALMLEQLEYFSPELQAIYRVHLPPLRVRMQRFKEQLESLISERNLSEDWQWNPEQALADYVRELPNSLADKRVRAVIERMVMLTNRASNFAADADLHYALGVNAYARFSSPMREIVGIFTHKELLEALDKLHDRDSAADSQLRSTIIDVANRAKKRQTMLAKECQLLAIESFLANDLLLTEDVRPRRRATLMGVRGEKLYVMLDDFALDLKIYLADVQAQYDCEYETSSVAAIAKSDVAPSFVVGDELTLFTQSWNDTRRRYIFVIEGKS